MEQALAVLTAAATILSSVVAFLQYRLSRAAARGPSHGPVRRPGRQPVAEGWSPPAQPALTVPGTVRALAVWLVVETTLGTALFFALLAVLLSNADKFGVEGVDAASANEVVVFAGIPTFVVATILLPLAVRYGARLRGGDEKLRVKLLGYALVDLVLGIFLAVGVLVLNRSADVTVPPSVFGVVLLFLCFTILDAVVYMFLLTARSTREWTDAQRTMP